MATLTITITGGAQNAGRTKTISSADVTRLVSAYRSLLSLPATATDTEVVNAWADYVITATKSQVRRFEEQAATQAATAGVGDIGVT